MRIDKTRWTKLRLRIAGMENWYHLKMPNGELIGDGLAYHTIFIGFGLAAGKFNKEEAIKSIFDYGQRTETGHILDRYGWRRPDLAECEYLLNQIRPIFDKQEKQCIKRWDRYSL